jgi:uncharacterized protein involved in type VI secretion and phage assembly
MSRSLLDLLLPPTAADGRIYGVVTAVVTNNKDPDQIGRVKLRFPWLDDTHESWWARVAVPMAGKERGLCFLPEVDDEVLVAFEHGDPQFPYVVGALWTSSAGPPAANADGKNNLRVISSRSGMILRFDDTKDAEAVTLSDKDGKCCLVIDMAAGTVSLTADADLTITATNGALKLSGNGVEIVSQGDLKLGAAAAGELKVDGELTIKGATVNIN